MLIGSPRPPSKAEPGRRFGPMRNARSQRPNNGSKDERSQNSETGTPSVSSPLHGPSSHGDSVVSFEDVYGTNSGGPPLRRNAPHLRAVRDMKGARRSAISLCEAVMQNPNFDRFILTVILINTMDMAFQDPTVERADRILERIFLAIFICEMVSVTVRGGEYSNTSLNFERWGINLSPLPRI